MSNLARVKNVFRLLRTGKGGKLHDYVMSPLGSMIRMDGIFADVDSAIAAGREGK